MSESDLLLVAENDAGEIIGFAGAGYGSREKISKLFPGLDAEATAKLVTVGKAATLRLLAVRRAWQRRGVGSQLHDRRMEWLAERHVEQTICIAWERSDTGAAAVRLLEEGGFKLLLRVPNFWGDVVPSNPSEYCPACGEVCRCFAQIWRWPN